MINKDDSLPSTDNNGTYSRSKLRKRSENVYLIINSRGKEIKVHDYSQKLIDNFKLIVVNPPPKVTDQEKRSIATLFGSFYQYQSIENNTKRILNHILNSWNENKSSTHWSEHETTPAEIVALKVYSIELKYYCLYFLIYSQRDYIYVETSP